MRTDTMSQVLYRYRSCQLIASLLLLSVIWVHAGHSQEMRIYNITCDPAEFAYINANPDTIFYIDCAFEYNGQTWDDTRIRLRGESSLEYPKKSYKINFDADNRFYLRDKVNLISEWKDATFSQEFLAYDLYNQAGLYASSAWFARLYVNGVYIGLYLDVEQVDEHFLSYTDLPDDASIFKADDYGCVLSTTEVVEELWEKKTNEETGFGELNELIEWLDTTPDETFFEDLAGKFDREILARVIAVNALCANQSTYYHNFYLIKDVSGTGHWYMLPWDMDNTFGYWSSYEMPQYFRSGHQLLSQLNVLIRRCWLDESMCNLIFAQMDELTSSIVTQAYYEDITNTLQALLYEAVLEDTAKQFTIEDFTTQLAVIPEDVANRAASIEDRRINDPLPFDFHPAVVTPAGVYFSWIPTTVSDGSVVSYRIWLADNKYFTGEITEFSGLNAPSYFHNELETGSYYWRMYAVTDAGGETRSLSFFHKFEIEENPSAGTLVTEPITTSTSWHIEGSPYRLPEGLTIETGAVLTIEPGIVVQIGNGKSINIEGGLTAVGTESNLIYFAPEDMESNWGSINIDSPSNTVNIGFASLKGSGSDDNGPVPVPGGMFQILDGDLYIIDSELSSGTSGAISAVSASVNVERVTMEDFITSDLIFIKYGNFNLRSCNFPAETGNYNVSDIVDINFVSEESQISECEFYGCNDDIIDLDGVINFDISRNVIRGAIDKGISIGSGSDGIYVSNNAVTACSIGIGIEDSSSAMIYNNIAAFNSVGFTINEGEHLSATIRNCVFWNNDTEILAAEEADLTLEYCLTGGDTVFSGEGNLTGDPLFTDPENGNFYPLETSPLIDAGYGTGHPLTDVAFQQRIDVPYILNTGSGVVPYVDIGIYEYDSDDTTSAPLPSIYHLPQNYPNPFNTTTTIHFSILEGDWAEVDIYDVGGRKVYNREFRDQDVDEVSLEWNGTNGAGTQLGSGLYICRVRQELGSRAIKMVLLR